MADLSPAAQAVLDATGRKTWYRNDDIAAALRAAVHEKAESICTEEHGKIAVVFVDDIHAIADELEGSRD